MAKKRISFQGEDVEGEIVEFESEREPWSTYLLHDGTTLKVKCVLADVVRLDNVFTTTGEPQYVVQVSPVIATSVPDGLKKRD